MIITKAAHQLSDSERAGILQLLTNHNYEFIPPLSHRNSTTQNELSGGNEHGLREYYDNLMTQNFLLKIDDTTEEVIGFMSYRDDYELPEDSTSSGKPSLYVSTVIVNHEHRGHNITRDFYHTLIPIAQKTRL